LIYLTSGDGRYTHLSLIGQERARRLPRDSPRLSRRKKG